MAKTTAEIRPEVEAYVRTHYTTTEDTSCGRCGRDDGECPIYFGPTFLGTLQGRPANYDPMCWEDAVEFEMNARADSGEWDPDLEDDECEACGAVGVPLFPCNVNDPENIAVNCADCIADPEGAADAALDERPDGTYSGGWVGGEPPADSETAAELLEGEPPMTTYENCPVCQNINGAGIADCPGHDTPPATSRMHFGQNDISYCDECGASNWYDEDQTTCPRCEGLGLANRAAWERYDAMIARGYR